MYVPGNYPQDPDTCKKLTIHSISLSVPSCILVVYNKEFFCVFWVFIYSEGIHSLSGQHLTPLGFAEGRISFVPHRHSNAHLEAQLKIIHLASCGFLALTIKDALSQVVLSLG